MIEGTVKALLRRLVNSEDAIEGLMGTETYYAALTAKELGYVTYTYETTAAWGATIQPIITELGRSILELEDL